MFLSQVRLTDAVVSDSQLGKLLQRNSYGMHSLLWDLFDQKERFLFREENSAEQLGTRRRLPLYYVLSTSQPATQSPLFNVQTKSFSPSLRTGDLLGFKLRANPTVARRKAGEKNSRRHDVVMDAQYHWLHTACNNRELITEGKKSDLKTTLLTHPDFQNRAGEQRLESELTNAIEFATEQWLTERADRNGFSLQSSQATAYRWNALPEKGRNAGFSSLDYEGVLVVEDPAQFSQCLGKGIGPAKAFGCGLMLIRRL